MVVVLPDAMHIDPKSQKTSSFGKFLNFWPSVQVVFMAKLLNICFGPMYVRHDIILVVAFSE